MNRRHRCFSLGFLAFTLASITLAEPVTPSPSNVRREVASKDACGRPYRAVASARRDVNQADPDFAAKNKCTWKVGADRLCRCVREVGQDPGNLQAMKLKKRAVVRPAPPREGSR